MKYYVTTTQSFLVEAADENAAKLEAERLSRNAGNKLLTCGVRNVAIAQTFAPDPGGKWFAKDHASLPKVTV